MSPRACLLAGTLLMAAAVIAGAFGAHALRERLAPDLLAVWQTGVTYHAWHALALVALGIWGERRAPSRAAALAGALFVAGIVLFAGSLYALALTGVRALGAVTPLGGVAFIAGWIAWAWAVK